MAKRRGRKKLTVVGPHLGHKEMKHKGGHKGRGRKRGRRKYWVHPPCRHRSNLHRERHHRRAVALLLW